MSEAEYECLISGAKLMNATDHSKSGQRTDSVKVVAMTQRYAKYAQLRREFVAMGIIKP